MKLIKLCVSVLLCWFLYSGSASAQKVQVGYDKGVDFSRYVTYTWAEPATPPARPLLYTHVVGSIDELLSAKGLKRQPSGGDLVLVPAGGVGFGLNQAAATPVLGTYGGIPPGIDSTMWTGAAFGGPSTTQLVPEGALMLSFVDRSSNKVVWTGSVTEKLDVEHKTESLKLAEKAITKLLKGFPPGKK